MKEETVEALEKAVNDTSGESKESYDDAIVDAVDQTKQTNKIGEMGTENNERGEKDGGAIAESHAGIRTDDASKLENEIESPVLAEKESKGTEEATKFAEEAAKAAPPAAEAEASIDAEDASSSEETVEDKSNRRTKALEASESYGEAAKISCII